MQPAILHYEPRPFQRKLHAGWSSHRDSIVLCHRRGGKTVGAVAQLIDDCIRCQLPAPQVAYICPTYTQAKRVALGYFRAMLRDVKGVTVRESDLTISLPGQRTIYLLGADNPDRLRGMYLDAAVVDEFADCRESLLGEILRPCLADRNGSLYLIGTVKGRNHLWRAYEKARDDTSGNWFHANLLPDDTGSLTPEQLDYLRREMTEDEYRGEMLNDPDAGVKGAYYGGVLRWLEDHGRIREVPYDDSMLVDVAMDLGMADATAIWFLQCIGGREVRVIDCVEYTSTSFVQILTELRQRPYQFGRFIGPHDLNVREFTTGTSRLDAAYELGVTFEVAPRHTVIEGIAATERVLKRCYFDRKATQPGRDALALYRSEWDEKRRVLSRNPVHDWTSHYADALRYFAVATDGQQASLFNNAAPLNYANNGLGRYA